MNKYPDIVPQKSPIVVLDNKSAVCMDKNGKDTKYTRHIARIENFVRNGDRFKIHKIYWWERSLQLADIATENVGANDFNTKIKYIIVLIEN